jgi:porin
MAAEGRDRLVRLRLAAGRCAAAMLLLVAGCTWAGEGSPNQGLLGDFGGLRTTWYEHGLDLQLNYFSEPAYNAQGGSDRLLRYADQITAAATLDLDKLWHWPKGIIKLVLTDRNGDNLSADANLHTLMQVQEVYGRGNILRLTELSYEQVLFGNLMDVKLGRLGVGGSFDVWSCQFMNLSFCGELPGNIVATWYNWPVSQWAARVRLRASEDVRFELGVYQINPAYLENHNGLALNPSGTIGALIPAEVDWSPRWGEAQLPGTYRFGGWYDTARQPDVYLAANGQPLVLNPGLPPLIRNGESGVYLTTQQQLTRMSGSSVRGLSVFLNFVEADHNTATISELLNAGVLFTGPLAWRPGDVVGFGVGRTRVNPRVADGQMLSNSTGLYPQLPVQHAEYPFEAFYDIKFTSWLSLQPLVQYIDHPGGTSAYGNVVVLGANFAVTF